MWHWWQNEKRMIGHEIYELSSAPFNALQVFTVEQPIPSYIQKIKLQVGSMMVSDYQENYAVEGI